MSRINEKIGRLKMDNDTKELKRYIESIERLEDERKELTAQINDTYSEAKAAGFNPKAMRKIISMRKLKKEERQEIDYLLEAYKEILGM